MPVTEQSQNKASQEGPATAQKEQEVARIDAAPAPEAQDETDQKIIDDNTLETTFSAASPRRRETPEAVAVEGRAGDGEGEANAEDSEPQTVESPTARMTPLVPVGWDGSHGHHYRGRSEQAAAAHWFRRWRR